jgi:hypothetical protein
MARSRRQPTARAIIARWYQGRILRVFPGQWLDSTLDQIWAAASGGDRSAQTALKLLTDQRFRNR